MTQQESIANFDTHSWQTLLKVTDESPGVEIGACCQFCKESYRGLPEEFPDLEYQPCAVMSLAE